MSNKATIIDPLDARWVCQNNAGKLDRQGYSDDTHSQKLWEHMTSRRQKKGGRLVFLGVLFLIVMVSLDFLATYVLLPELLTIAVILLLGLKIWIIRSHTDRRNGTLEILREARG